MSFGTKLQELRNIKNITQEELADRLGVTRQTVSRWETDTAYPDLRKVVELCNFLEISTDYLLKNEEDIEKPKETSKLLECLVGKTVSISFYETDDGSTNGLFDDIKYTEKILSIENNFLKVLYIHKKKNTQEERLIRLSDVASIKIIEE